MSVTFHNKIWSSKENLLPFHHNTDEGQYAIVFYYTLESVPTTVLSIFCVKIRYYLRPPGVAFRSRKQ